jgi:ABC-type phosphate/phosphonate transport system substrate-binding protein
MLHEREEEGVGLHLATIEKEGQITALTGALSQAEELNNNLHQELAIQTAAIGDQEALIDSMKNDNLDLRERVAELESALLEREADAAALRESR